jgi:hypothetical protein
MMDQSYGGSAGGREIRVAFLRWQQDKVESWDAWDGETHEVPAQEACLLSDAQSWQAAVRSLQKMAGQHNRMMVGRTEPPVRPINPALTGAAEAGGTGRGYSPPPRDRDRDGSEAELSGRLHRVRPPAGRRRRRGGLRLLAVVPGE